MEERIRLYAGHFPNALSMTPVRHRDMRYRVMLRLMMARLQSTFSDGLFPYDSADELAGDLRLIIDSLDRHGGQHTGLFHDAGYPSGSQRQPPDHRPQS